jgi:class 3 adenylate cyclase
MGPTSSNLAILFADISGSTELYEILGDVIARRKVAECLDLVTAVVRRQNGVVIKTIGDEIMSTFESPEDAAIAACEMQEVVEGQMVEQTVKGPIALSIRVGLHYGPAILEGGDVFGDAVNVAARMAQTSKAGQIITTQDTVNNLPAVLRASTRFIDRAPIKGKSETIDIFEVIWQQEDITRMQTGVVVEDAPTRRLILRYNQTELELNDETSYAVLGRSKTCDMTVDEKLASRHHVRIESRRGKYFITDQSTNGTYVRNNGFEEAFIRREEMPLSGHGEISLGRSFNEDPKEIVEFDCET